ncbi:hypothetical protein ACMWP9_35005, partial [Escherichia coli]
DVVGWRRRLCEGRAAGGREQQRRQGLEEGVAKVKVCHRIRNAWRASVAGRRGPVTRNVARAPRFDGVRFPARKKNGATPM